MPAYHVFVGGVVVLVALVLLLATLTVRELESASRGARLGGGQLFSIREWYLNVVASQVVVVVLLLGLAWVTDVPGGALGFSGPEGGHSAAIAAGIGLGLALYVLNEMSVGLLDQFGIAYSEALRDALSPETMRGWLALLLVVLPVIAAAEELLFRAAIIGGIEAGLGVSPWLLVLASSIVFAAGHGLQGPGGVLVTGSLGLLLGAAFVISQSLLVVIVAHYVVNALEFVVNEGFGIDWRPVPSA